MAKSRRSLLIYEVNNALVAYFKRRKYVFNAIRENKILAKISNLQYCKTTHLAIN